LKGAARTHSINSKTSSSDKTVTFLHQPWRVKYLYWRDYYFP